MPKFHHFTHWLPTWDSEFMPDLWQFSWGHKGLRAKMRHFFYLVKCKDKSGEASLAPHRFKDRFGGKQVFSASKDRANSAPLTKWIVSCFCFMRPTKKQFNLEVSTSAISLRHKNGRCGPLLWGYCIFNDLPSNIYPWSTYPLRSRLSLLLM